MKKYLSLQVKLKARSFLISKKGIPKFFNRKNKSTISHQKRPRSPISSRKKAFSPPPGRKYGCNTDTLSVCITDPLGKSIDEIEALYKLVINQELDSAPI